MSIFVTSDWHLNHDREFIWKVRGFGSVEEMNNEIVRRHNEVVALDDIVYVLGDLMLGNNADESIELMSQMNGKFYIILGNHDTPNREKAYRETFDYKGYVPPRVFDALRITYRGYHFYMSHYPTITSNLEKEHLKQCTINLFGHTHQTSNFFYDLPFMYHVGMDSHNCYPVLLDNIIEEIKQKTKESKNYL